MSHGCEEFAVRIKKMRESRGLIQAQMAELAGCSTRNYQNIEAGKTQAGSNILYNIIRNLPASPDELFGIEHSDSGRESIDSINRLLLICDDRQLELIQHIIREVLRTWPKNIEE